MEFMDHFFDFIDGLDGCKVGLVYDEHRGRGNLLFQRGVHVVSIQEVRGVKDTKLLHKLEPIVKYGKFQIPFQVRRICNACGFDDKDIGSNGVIQFVKAFNEVGFYADTKDGTFADFHHVKFFALNQSAIYSDLTEFVHQDRKLLVFGELVNDTVQKGGFSASQETGDEIHASNIGHKLSPLRQISDFCGVSVQVRIRYQILDVGCRIKERDLFLLHPASSIQYPVSGDQRQRLRHNT